MSHHAIRQVLQGVPHFQSLRRELFDRVVGMSRLRVYRKGEFVFRQDDPCRGFFVVRRGGARLYRVAPDGRERVLRIVSPNSAFAEAALFQSGHYPVFCTAVDEGTELVEIAGAPFLELFRSEAALAEAMVAGMCRRLHGAIGHMEELIALGAGARLAHYILGLPGREDESGTFVELPSSKKDIASYLSVTPETLSRLLRRWSDLGWISVRGSRLDIHDAPALGAISDGAEGPAVKSFRAGA
ncbi:MAG TPA: Crp/Fnr family transcriptional regulator [Planctomycetes bacterium]|nr:Crp/Fnr family transcriptional regulator [Planctomycetota bacterium]